MYGTKNITKMLFKLTYYNCYYNDKVVILLKIYASDFYIKYSTDMLSLLPEN